MRYLFPLMLAIIFRTVAVEAQSAGYLYIETEPSRPFYLRTRDSLYSSAAGNYMILAPLRNMVGEIIVGFPGASAAFSFTLKDTSVEQGLIIRNQKEEGWRLFDFKKNELVNIRRLGRQANEFKDMVKRNDAFAIRLSEVVNDSIILFYKPVQQPFVKTEGQPKAAPVKEPVPLKPQPATQPKAKTTAQPEAQPAGITLGVKRLSKLDLGSKWSLQYEVMEGEQADTIRIEIDKPVKGKHPVKGSPPVKRKAPAKGKKPVKTVAIHISAGRPGSLFSHHAEVFYRGFLPGYKLCRVPKAGECPYCTG